MTRQIHPNLRCSHVSRAMFTMHRPAVAVLVCMWKRWGSQMSMDGLLGFDPTLYPKPPKKERTYRSVTMSSTAPNCDSACTSWSLCVGIRYKAASDYHLQSAIEPGGSKPASIEPVIDTYKHTQAGALQHQSTKARTLPDEPRDVAVHGVEGEAEEVEEHHLIESIIVVGVRGLAGVWCGCGGGGCRSGSIACIHTWSPRLNDGMSKHPRTFSQDSRFCTPRKRE